MRKRSASFYWSLFLSNNKGGVSIVPFAAVLKFFCFFLSLWPFKDISFDQKVLSLFWPPFFSFSLSFQSRRDMSLVRIPALGLLANCWSKLDIWGSSTQLRIRKLRTGERERERKKTAKALSKPGKNSFVFDIFFLPL